MNLREKMLKGGAYLIVRQGFGLIVGFIGVLLITRAIGPGNYGIYTTAYGIVVYLSNLASLGAHVYLIRRESEPDINVYHQAFTLMFLTGCIGLVLGLATIPIFEWWLQNRVFIPPLITMLLAIPLITLAGPAMARLERDLNYRPISIIELTGQIINYVIAILLAYHGKGVWAPVTGYLAWQVFNLLATCIVTRLLPRPTWSWSLVKEIVGYGAGYSVSMWVWQLRSLVNPLIVGRFAGPVAVGNIALAIRLVEALNFVKTATWRLSIAGFAKLQRDYLRLKRALENAMLFQVLAVGPLFVFFAYTARWIIPFVFGDRWTGVLSIYPFIALGYLFNAMFSMHSSVLFVLGRTWGVTSFHMVHILIFVGSALFLLPHLGLIGYGLAEVFALLSYLVIHLNLVGLFRPHYTDAVLWFLAFSVPLGATYVNLPYTILLLIPLCVVVLMKGPRQKVLEYIKFARMGG
ncbi:MAG: polysaccharide biosynthesis protein [Firmicutes bacterium]|nr:polysaccharide biosynthesis protein [Bacillota bacterium]